MAIDIKDTSYVDNVVTEGSIRFKTEFITAVIPAYNESKTIYRVVSKAKQYANEVIVIDDGSEDDTGEIARSAGATVIRMPLNCGKGNALAIGLNTAAMNGCTVVVCLDGDGQHDPADIPSLTTPVLADRADMVIGSRFLSRESKELIPKYRRFGQSVLTLATNFGNKVKITDSQSGYRAFRASIVKAFDYSESRMGIESEMVRDAVRLRLRLTEVPIVARYQGLKTSTFRPARHGVSVLGSILRTIRTDHPLLYFGGGGVALMILGVPVGLYSIIEYSSLGVLPVGATIVAAMLIFSGLLLTLVGIILNAISGIGSKKMDVNLWK